MKTKITVLAIALFTTLISFGQDKQQDLNKLFELLETKKIIDQSFENVKTMMLQQFNTRSKEKATSAQIQKFDTEIIPMMKSFSQKLIDETVVPLYDKHFTHQDIKELIAFYETPVGKKFIKKTPQITKDMMTSIMGKDMIEFQKQLAQKIKQTLKPTN